MEKNLLLFVIYHTAVVKLVVSELQITGSINNVSFANFVKHKDRQLSGSPLKKIVGSITDCLVGCAFDNRCLSTNVNTARDGQGFFQCDLLDIDKYEYSEKFYETKGIDHYAIKFDSSLLQSCAAIKKADKSATSGVYRITTSPSRSAQVYCGMVTSGGGWTVFQRRLDGSVDFYRGWVDYKLGFGNKKGEYWLGLDRIHAMTLEGKNRLRVELEDFEGNTRYAEYDTFLVADEANNYTLTIDNYSGNVLDSLIESHNNMQFSTKDRDNDDHSIRHCAQSFSGAWWYKHCHASNLNGLYLDGFNHSVYGKGIVWSSWKGNYRSLKKTEMKIRPKDF